MTIIFILSRFGINDSARKFIAQYNKTESLQSVLKSSLKLRVFWSFSFFILFLIIAKPLAFLLGKPELSDLLFFGTPLIFLYGSVEYFKDVFSSLHRNKYNFIINLSEHGLKLLFVILALLLSNTLIAVVFAFSGAMIISSMSGLYIFYNIFYKDLSFSDRDFRKDILRYSYPFIIISFGFMTLTEVDTIMLGLLSTDVEVGIYAVAKQIVVKLPHLSLAIAMGTMPIFAQINKDNKEELRNTLSKILKINSLLFVAIIMGIVLLSPIFLPLIFGPDYSAAVLPLQILSTYLFFFATSIIFSYFLDYTGRAKKRAINILFTIVLNIFLNLMLIPKYGATGAAIATSISYLPYFILNWIEVKNTFETFSFQ